MGTRSILLGHTGFETSGYLEGQKKLESFCIRRDRLEGLRNESIQASKERSRDDVVRETEFQIYGSTYGHKVDCVLNSVARSNSKSRRLPSRSKLPAGVIRQDKKLFVTSELPLIVLGRSWKMRQPQRKRLIHYHDMGTTQASLGFKWEQVVLAASASLLTSPTLPVEEVGVWEVLKNVGFTMTASDDYKEVGLVYSLFHYLPP